MTVISHRMKHKININSYLKTPPSHQTRHKQIESGDIYFNKNVLYFSPLNIWILVENILEMSLKD